MTDTDTAPDEASPSLGQDRLALLGKKPSQPPRSNRELRVNLKDSFRVGGDAGLKMLRRASPEFDQSLGAAIGGLRTSEPDLAVFALRLKVGVFGRSAPQRHGYRRVGTGSAARSVYEPIGEWPIVESATKRHEDEQVVYLDGAQEQLLPGSWIVFDFASVPRYGDEEIVQVTPAPFSNTNAAETYLVARSVAVGGKVARSAYGITGDAARVELGDPWIRIAPDGSEFVTDEVHDRDFQVIRGTAVYAQSETLELADAPNTEPVCDGAAETAPLELAGLMLGLEPGRYVIVSGERADLDVSGVPATEAAMIADVVHGVRDRQGAWAYVPDGADGGGNREKTGPLHGDRVHTFVRLERPLAYCYRRERLVIYGNVVKASHGETKAETLGSGDGARPLQSFTLKQPPLTYLPAPTMAGAESALKVFVNDVRWHEVPSFIDRGPAERVFIAKRDDAETTTITFGNGHEGARLPTGLANVQAVYRSGLGRGGNLRAGQLTTLQTRPQGVKEVRNPLRASGGADPETRDQARQNAPLAVMALDRLVSVADYADFARAFAGIGKAASVRLSDGRQSIVHVTIAGAADAPIDPGSDLHLNLRRAFALLGDPLQPVLLAQRALRALVISAGLRIHPDHRWERVVDDVRVALLDRFGFARRDLAQDVAASEVVSAIQAVPGVLYVDLDSFGAIAVDAVDATAEGGLRPATPEETAKAVATIVSDDPAPRAVAEPARRAPKGGLIPAELVILVPDLPATLVFNQITD